MKQRGSVATVLCCCVLLSWPSLARAQSAAHDTQLWLLLLGQLKVGEQWLVHAEAQPRWNDDISQRDQVLLRGAIGRRLGTRASVWAGYAYTPRHVTDDWTHEQRLWQQLSVAFSRVGKWTPSIRIRPEQRFLESWGDASYRVRALVRMVRPLGASRWSIAASDEYFVTLDETDGGPRRGFDQNRLFAGMLRNLTSETTIETGYLWQWLPETASQPQRHNHTVLVWLTWTP